MYDILVTEFLVLNQVCNQIASNDVRQDLVFGIIGLARVRYEFETLDILVAMS